MVNRQRQSLIIAAVLALAALAALVLTGLTGDVDREVTERYFVSPGTWLIDHQQSPLRLWLYDGPKAVFVVFGIGMLGLACRQRQGGISRREAMFVFACLAAVPLAVGFIKQHSNVQCPASLEQYGGTRSDADAHLRLAGFFETHRNGGCWPSGHSSGAFALFCLAWLDRRLPVRLALAMPGLLVGIATGWYQVARGAHFASHVVATALISVCLTALLAAVFRINEGPTAG